MVKGTWDAPQESEEQILAVQTAAKYLKEEKPRGTKESEPKDITPEFQKENKERKPNLPRKHKAPGKGDAKTKTCNKLKWN